MSLQNELKAILHIIPRLFSELWESEYNIVRSYGKSLGIALLVIIISLCSYGGYRWYVVSLEHKAQETLAEHMQEYQRAVKAGASDEIFRMEMLFASDYMRHKKSSIAPLFLLFQADAQIQQGKDTEALDALQNTIKALPAKSPMMPLIKTKQALVQLDNHDEAIQQRGQQELIQLARDEKNQFSDMALFYLGRYYWSHDNLGEAKKAWQELIDMPRYSQPYASPSPWVDDAREALQQIGA